MKLFTDTSMAGNGWAILLVSIVAQMVGLDLEQGAVTEYGIALATVVGLAVALWGQIRRKDLKWGIFRNSTENTEG